MAAAARKYKDLDSEITDYDEDEMDDEIFEVVGQENMEKMNCFKELAGCGAHRLNNALWDAINGVNFFDQANEFAVKHHGPKLANTRWHGHLRQLVFVEKHTDLLNID